MNYERIYFSLMASRKALARKKVGDGTLERHHILPKCMGGLNTEQNLVLLTPREHYLAHLLLVRFTSGKQKSQMSYALLMMNRNNPNQTRISTARQYADAKQTVAANCSGLRHPRYGVSRTPEEKAAMSARMTGSGNHRYGQTPWNFGLTAETSASLRQSGATYSRTVAANPSILEGRSHTEATRLKISAAHKGRAKSTEHRSNLSKALAGRSPTRSGIEKSAALRRGIPQEQVVCPHCFKSGGRTAMLRWHFDACKEKQDGSQAGDRCETELP